MQRLQRVSKSPYLMRVNVKNRWEKDLAWVVGTQVSKVTFFVLATESTRKVCQLSLAHFSIMLMILQDDKGGPQLINTLPTPPHLLLISF
jgi:hypothetical protein